MLALNRDTGRSRTEPVLVRKTWVCDIPRDTVPLHAESGGWTLVQLTAANGILGTTLTIDAQQRRATLESVDASNANLVGRVVSEAPPEVAP